MYGIVKPETDAPVRSCDLALYGTLIDVQAREALSANVQSTAESLLELGA